MCFSSYTPVKIEMALAEQLLEWLSGEVGCLAAESHPDSRYTRRIGSAAMIMQVRL